MKLQTFKDGLSSYNENILFKQTFTNYKVAEHYKK